MDETEDIQPKKEQKAEPKRQEIKPYKYGTEFNNKKVSMAELDSLLRGNVCIISFVRKHPVSGKNSYRRMLCSNCYDFLNSYNGKVKLSYRPPTQAPPYNPSTYNLVVTWDLLMIDYRMVSMNGCFLSYQYPVNTKQERNMFWRDLFNKTFLLMSPPEKLGWMSTW